MLKIRALGISKMLEGLAQPHTGGVLLDEASHALPSTAEREQLFRGFPIYMLFRCFPIYMLTLVSLSASPSSDFGKQRNSGGD